MAPSAERVKVRAGSLKDLRELVELEATAFRTDRFSQAQFRYLLTRANARVLILELRGGPAGAAILLWRKGSSVGRLYDLAISPALARRGLGGLLLKACEEEATKQGCKVLSLEVRKDNKGAIAFYKKHGYRATESLPGYYSDGVSGLRMKKRLSVGGPARLDLKVPYCRQTLEFTCGPACLMMAFKHFTPDLVTDRKLELTLWREATLIFTTSGMGGTGPFGMALASHRRGYQTRVIVSGRHPPFLFSVRHDDKRKVIRIVHEDLKAKAQAFGVPVENRDFDFEEIIQEMCEGRVPIVLVSTYHLHGDRAPHWVVLTGFDSERVYLHDPYEGFYERDPRLAQKVKVAKSQLSRMWSYGKHPYKSVLFIGPRRGRDRRAPRGVDRLE